jgi:GLPGLI family protein
MLYHQKEFESEIYLIQHSEVIDWKLSQEKKKIGIYTCYKATKKDFFIGSSGNQIPRNITAWYSPEIPYSFGPLKYNGLPGLILELSNDKVTFFAKKIYLNIKEKTSIEKPKKGIEISKKKYDSIRRGLAADFSKRYKRN